MTTDDLEKLIEAGTETQKVDFKGSCPWDSKMFAKDILAMANYQDGGIVIIGIKEENGQFIRQGISEVDKLTYKIDDMKDQISSFADPTVGFDCSVIKDFNNTEFVVIKIYPFESIPIICKKDSTETNKGIVYYRNSNRRVESAPISNSYDMRDLIERATIKMMNRYQKIGLQPSKPTEELLANERGDL